MQLTYQGLRDFDSWKSEGIELPSYNPEDLAENTN